jgi:hypothetical protein
MLLTAHGQFAEWQGELLLNRMLIRYSGISSNAL